MALGRARQREAAAISLARGETAQQAAAATETTERSVYRLTDLKPPAQRSRPPKSFPQFWEIGP